MRSNSEGPGCAEPQWGHCSGTARYQQTVWSSCFLYEAVLARWLPRVPPVRSNNESPGCAEPQWGHCSGTARYKQTFWSSCFLYKAVLARWLPRVPPVRSNSESPGCAEPQWGRLFRDRAIPANRLVILLSCVWQYFRVLPVRSNSEWAEAPKGLRARLFRDQTDTGGLPLQCVRSRQNRLLVLCQYALRRSALFRMPEH